MDIFIVALVIVLISLVFNIIVGIETKSDKKQQERMKRSLEDAYIIDPETGAKLTLEQAESGHWVAHDNEFREVPEEELKSLAFEEQEQIERALNYLRSSRRFLKAEDFVDDAYEVISNCVTLTHYDDWSYASLFRFDLGYIFTVAPETYSPIYYCESQLMMWLHIPTIEGHYYFREKTKAEAFFDKIRNDDELKFENYECFTFKKSTQILHIRRLMDILVNFKGLEIEIKNDHLFIKTLRLINKEDVLTFERLITLLEPLIKAKQ
ncbi:hypothetical protein ACU8DI_08410 [Psychroserpens sp. BH13MA-6]